MPFEPQKIDTSTINGGVEYVDKQDSVQAETINALIKSASYTQSLATNTPNIESLDGQGTPSVTIEEFNGTPRFKFSNFNFSGISVLFGGDYDLDFDNLIMSKNSGVYMLDSFTKNMPPELDLTNELSNIYLEIETKGSYRDQIKKFTLDWGMFVAERVVRLVFNNSTQTINKQEDSGWITKDLNFLPTIITNTDSYVNSFNLKPNTELYSMVDINARITLTFPSDSSIKVGSKIYVCIKVHYGGMFGIDGNVKTNSYSITDGNIVEINAKWNGTYWLAQVNQYTP